MKGSSYRWAVPEPHTPTHASSEERNSGLYILGTGRWCGSRATGAPDGERRCPVDSVVSVVERRPGT
jgi:hypothetical protein